MFTLDGRSDGAGRMRFVATGAPRRYPRKPLVSLCGTIFRTLPRVRFRTFSQHPHWHPLMLSAARTIRYLAVPSSLVKLLKVLDSVDRIINYQGVGTSTHRCCADAGSDHLSASIVHELADLVAITSEPDPTATSGPFHWYPLVLRKTYE
jgi:hypothetical protein